MVSTTSTARGKGARPVYKLYISPEIEVIGDVFSIVVDVLGSDSAYTIKVGSDVYGMQRPDKMIAYFSSLSVLLKTAEQLAHELNGFPVHGVPFTAQLDNYGLLSWGVDPPRLERTPGLENAESWRVWVVNRLASAILIARGKATEGLGLPPWRFAIERLRLEEVDVDNWTPLTSIWQRDA
ncbi:hypothetical protein HC891_13670 [Candidatus Gracilibacteria bacterium]|nr:hypothetical protein [Candidatus Gracilibacteria bacterium]